MNGRRHAGLLLSVFVFAGCGGASRGDRTGSPDSGSGTTVPPVGDMATAAPAADLASPTDLAPPSDLAPPADLVDAGPTTARLTVTATGGGTV
ncbi:MAG TPA: hypothetical protein VHB97_16280, partial [Polyangia bacterium]|nr:hypothetical protein [Polyangia bacterium]